MVIMGSLHAPILPLLISGWGLLTREINNAFGFRAQRGRIMIMVIVTIGHAHQEAPISTSLRLHWVILGTMLGLYTGIMENKMETTILRFLSQQGFPFSTEK